MTASLLRGLPPMLKVNRHTAKRPRAPLKSASRVCQRFLITDHSLGKLRGQHAVWRTVPVLPLSIHSIPCSCGGAVRSQQCPVRNRALQEHPPAQDMRPRRPLGQRNSFGRKAKLRRSAQSQRRAPMIRQSPWGSDPIQRSNAHSLQVALARMIPGNAPIPPRRRGRPTLALTLQTHLTSKTFKETWILGARMPKAWILGARAWILGARISQA